MSRSRISHANIVGFSLLYCSIFDTTAGVATFGLEPPIKPGGRSVPAESENEISQKFIMGFFIILSLNDIGLQIYMPKNV